RGRPGSEPLPGPRRAARRLARRVRLRSKRLGVRRPRSAPAGAVRAEYLRRVDPGHARRARRTDDRGCGQGVVMRRAIIGFVASLTAFAVVGCTSASSSSGLEQAKGADGEPPTEAAT